MSNRSNLPLLLAIGAGTGLILFGSSKKVTRHDLVNAINIVTGGALKPTLFFIKYYPFARQSELTTKVPALVTLAQAAVESGYGVHAPGNNFFGIKAGSGWNGKTQKLKTWECGRTGVAATDHITDEIIEIFPPGSSHGNAGCNANGFYSYRVYSIFRAYDTPEQSFTDHANFLIKNKRYKPAFTVSTPEDFALEVAKAGYSTSTTYGQVLVDTIAKARSAINL